MWRSLEGGLDHGLKWSNELAKSVLVSNPEVCTKRTPVTVELLSASCSGERNVPLDVALRSATDQRTSNVLGPRLSLTCPSKLIMQALGEA